MTHRAAGQRFGVSAASVSRWRAREREQGDARPKALGSDRRSQRIDAHKDLVLAARGADRDRTIEEARQALAVQGLAVGFGTLQRFFNRHAITCNKDRPRERAGPARRLMKRHAWFAGQPDLDADRLVFIDGNLGDDQHGAPLRALPARRTPEGRIPHGHRTTTTCVDALTRRGFIAPFILDRPINHDAFETYVADHIAGQRSNRAA